MAMGLVFFRDSLDRQISCAPFEDRSGGTQFHVEVIDKGEVVDHFALYGQEALDHTARQRGWKESK